MNEPESQPDSPPAEVLPWPPTTDPTDPQRKRKLPARSSGSRTEYIGLRVTLTERAEIARRAAEHEMTMTGFLVAAALGRLDVAAQADSEALWRETVERRLKQLEDDLGGSAGS